MHTRNRYEVSQDGIWSGLTQIVYCMHPYWFKSFVFLQMDSPSYPLLQINENAKSSNLTYEFN